MGRVDGGGEPRDMGQWRFSPQEENRKEKNRPETFEKFVALSR